MTITPAEKTTRKKKSPQTTVLRTKTGVRAGDLYLHWPRGSNNPTG